MTMSMSMSMLQVYVYIYIYILTYLSIHMYIIHIIYNTYSLHIYIYIYIYICLTRLSRIGRGTLFGPCSVQCPCLIPTHIGMGIPFGSRSIPARGPLFWFMQHPSYPESEHPHSGCSLFLEGTEGVPRNGGRK